MDNRIQFFGSSLTKWIYMHNLLNKCKIAIFPLSTFQRTPVSIKPELASQQQIRLRPSFVDLVQNIIFFIIFFKQGLLPSIAQAAALDAGSEQHIFYEGGNIMAASVNKRNGGTSRLRLLQFNTFSKSQGETET